MSNKKSVHKKVIESKSKIVYRYVFGYNATLRQIISKDLTKNSIMFRVGGLELDLLEPLESTYPIAIIIKERLNSKFKQVELQSKSDVRVSVIDLEVFSFDFLGEFEILPEEPKGEPEQEKGDSIN